MTMIGSMMSELAERLTNVLPMKYHVPFVAHRPPCLASGRSVRHRDAGRDTTRDQATPVADPFRIALPFSDSTDIGFASHKKRLRNGQTARIAIDKLLYSLVIEVEARVHSGDGLDLEVGPVERSCGSGWRGCSVCSQSKIGASRNRVVRWTPLTFFVELEAREEADAHASSPKNDRLVARKFCRRVLTLWPA